MPEFHPLFTPLLIFDQNSVCFKLRDIHRLGIGCFLQPDVTSDIGLYPSINQERSSADPFGERIEDSERWVSAARLEDYLDLVVPTAAMSLTFYIAWSYQFVYLTFGQIGRELGAKPHW